MSNLTNPVSVLYQDSTTGQPVPVTQTTPMPVALAGQYPTGATQITAHATGTTGAVVATLAAAVGKTTYISGFDVSAIGGTAPVGPIVVAGLSGGSFTYNLASSAGGSTLAREYAPSIPGSTTNTAITITTTADGTASAVAVNAWGYQI